MLIILRHRERGRVDLLGFPVEAVHQLLVGGEHHLRAGHVQGVGPGPGVVQQVSETVELRLHYGELPPLHIHSLQGTTWY